MLKKMPADSIASAEDDAVSWQQFIVTLPGLKSSQLNSYGAGGNFNTTFFSGNEYFLILEKK